MKPEVQQVYWIEGDGIGPEIWKVAMPVLNAAVKSAYGDTKKLEWHELLAGERALAESGSLLPEATIAALRQAKVAIKGPLGTPVGGGFRSLNVTLRQVFDLYACIRPIRWFPGIESPVKHPERVNMVVFRENTEDVYMGLEYAANSPEAKRLTDFLRENFDAKVPENAALGLKPMTEAGSRRLVRRAIEYALARNLPSLTLMHKGNIMKFTEGGFRAWGYAVAEEEFADKICLEKNLNNQAPHGLIIKDRIADAMFQEALIHPEQYSVIAAPNLNGDYISDALAAQVGGLGMAPGVNMSDSLAFFEATHGTAPQIAGKNCANPCSLLLSGALLLEHLGWNQAATKIEQAVLALIHAKTVTSDLATQMNASPVTCSQFGTLLLEHIG